MTPQDEYLAQVLAATPPLTEADRDYLTRLLTPVAFPGEERVDLTGYDKPDDA